MQNFESGNQEKKKIILPLWIFLQDNNSTPTLHLNSALPGHATDTTGPGLHDRASRTGRSLPGFLLLGEGKSRPAQNGRVKEDVSLLGRINFLMSKELKIQAKEKLLQGKLFEAGLPA